MLLLRGCGAERCCSRSCQVLSWGRPVRRGIPQGSVLGAALFISDVNDRIECVLGKFAGATKLKGVDGGWKEGLPFRGPRQQ